MGQTRTTRSPAQPAPFRSVAIAGLGMLGGSLALALRRLPHPPRILGWARREEAVRDALARSLVDTASTAPEEVLPAADLTVLCMPVESCLAFARRYTSLWRSGALVTDVGSTKRRLVEGLTPALAAHGVCFVGSHPMAGSEHSGLAHADAALYRRAVVFLTPAAGSDARACDRVAAFWRRLGAQPVRLPPRRHDALVARTSHVLHLYSAAAAMALLHDAADVYGTAGGFRDFTRLAASSPEMWAEIFAANRGEVLRALGRMERELGRAGRLLRERRWPELLAYLRRARAAREDWAERWHRIREGTP